MAAATWLVVGMHVRTTPNIPLLHFDLPLTLQHLLPPPPRAAPAAHDPLSCVAAGEGECSLGMRGCGDDDAGILSMGRCLGELSRRRGMRGRGGGDAAEGGPVIVLWATDHDGLAEGLLEALKASPNVTLVRLVHREQVRPSV